MEYKLNDCVESLVTGNKGIIQATYIEGDFMFYTGFGYEWLYPAQLKRIRESELPFRASLHYVSVEKQ